MSDTPRTDLAEKEKDTARLNAIMKNRWFISWNERHNAFIVQAKDQVCGNLAHGELRISIDAAIASLQ